MKSASFFCAEKRIAGSIGWKLYPLCGMIELGGGFVMKKVLATAMIILTVLCLFTACKKDETSIVDALKSIGENSGYAYRKKIAAANGIADYSGTAKENIRLLSLLRQGELIRPDTLAA